MSCMSSTMRASVAATLLFLFSSHLTLTLQWSIPSEIRGIHSSILSNDEKRALIHSLKSIQQTAGDSMTVVGFLASCNLSLLANPNSIQSILGSLESVRDYLVDSGVQEHELDRVMNPRLADNIAILSIIQKHVLNGTDKRDALLLRNMTVDDLFEDFTKDEVARYVKYALAAYGDAVIHAVNIDLHGEIDLRQGSWTKKRVSEHIGIPQQDLHLVDIDYSGDATQLRHYVAIDHAHRKVVLAIRGTFCASDAAVDLVGYARPFCGGQAHAGISIMTERLWERVGDEILEALHANDGYELVITGHSLGGGTALLLNILLHHEERIKGVSFRTFAFAAPPVFTPLNALQCQSAVNFVHGMDDVPVLSGDAIRHEVAALTAIDDDCKDMDLVTKARLILGREPPSGRLVQRAIDAFCKELRPVKGLPAVMAPCRAIAWACETPKSSGQFDLKLCSPSLLARSGIYVDSQSVLDHYPTRYEWAFTNLKVE